MDNNQSKTIYQTDLASLNDYLELVTKSIYSNEYFKFYYNPDLYTLISFQGELVNNLYCVDLKIFHENASRYHHTKAEFIDVLRLLNIILKANDEQEIFKMSINSQDSLHAIYRLLSDWAYQEDKKHYYYVNELERFLQFHTGDLDSSKIEVNAMINIIDDFTEILYSELSAEDMIKTTKDTLDKSKEKLEENTKTLEDMKRTIDELSKDEIDKYFDEFKDFTSYGEQQQALGYFLYSAKTSLDDFIRNGYGEDLDKTIKYLEHYKELKDIYGDDEDEY